MGVGRTHRGERCVRRAAARSTWTALKIRRSTKRCAVNAARRRRRGCAPCCADPVLQSASSGVAGSLLLERTPGMLHQLPRTPLDRVRLQAALTAGTPWAVKSRSTGISGAWASTPSTWAQYSTAATGRPGVDVPLHSGAAHPPLAHARIVVVVPSSLRL